jgi:hypothetical protein
MTYQQKFEELYKDFAEKSENHLKANNNLSKINGFGDKFEWDNFVKSKGDWQQAANRYHEFLANFNKIGLSPSDEM